MITGTISLGETRGFHLVATYLPAEGVVLAQLAVNGKELKFWLCRQCWHV